MTCLDHYMRAFCSLAAVWLVPAFGSTLPEPVGHVARVEGAAFVSSRGHTNAAKVGQAIIPGVALSTGAEGGLGVIMGDGSVLSFGPDSELTLDDYRFAPASDELRLRATLNRGTLNLIAGDMARLDPQAIAALTPGFTGADLANLVNEATLLATRRNAEAVAMQDFTAAIERIIAGLEKRNRLLNPREREIVAYHEMGHALVAMALPGVDPVHKVSIIPRGMGALGYTIQRPTEDRFLMTREELENKMAVLLGGRAAEWLVFAHLSTGAADDLAKVTDIARAMVTRYGMSTRLGHLALEREPNAFLGNEALLGLKPQHDYAESTATAIDEEVQELVQAAFQRSLSLLEARRELLERCARQLLQQETLDAEELRQLSAAAPDAAALPAP